MANYNGVMLWDAADDTEPVLAWPGVNFQKISARDAAEYADAVSAPVVTSAQSVSPLPLPSPLPTILLFDWSEGIEIEGEFLVDVLKAQTVGEERRLLADRPQRSQTLRHKGMSAAEMYSVVMNLYRYGNSRMPVPLYSDHSRVTSAALKEIFCDTSHRRFFPGQRFVICDFDDNNRPQNVEWGIVDNVAVTHIIPTVSLTNTYDRGRVYPMMDAEVSFDDLADLATDEKGELVMTVREIRGSSALLPTASGTPAGFTTYKDYPIFDAIPSAEIGYKPGMVRAGAIVPQGRGHVLYTMGDRPQAYHELDYRALSRAQAWPLIQFFDSRRGRLRAFWLASPQAMFKPLAITADDVTVSPIGYIEDIENFLSQIALVQKDGTILIRGISNVALDGGNYRIDFDEPLLTVPTLAQLRRVTGAFLVRFDTNFMRERWSTDGVVDITFRFQELLEEKEVAIICLQ